MSRRELQRQIDDPSQIPFAENWLREMARRGLQRGPVLLTMARPRRSLDQNARLWPMLTDVSRQCQLVINGERVWARPEDWKDVFSAALTREQRVAQGIDGGVVMLGRRTSRMRKAEFSELIELIYAYGSEHDVEWSEPARKTIGEYGSAQ